MAEKENEVDEVAEDAIEVEGEVAAAEGVPDHAELTALLEDARGKVDEHWDQCMRLQADIDNLRKRAERDLAHAHKFALQRFASELLPVRDSLEMGLAAFDTENTDKHKEGIELTLQVLTAVIGKFDIREVDPQEETFNPDFHQAISTQEHDDVAPNTVVAVVQKGYLLNERLIRPAMVIVSKAPDAG